MSINVPDFITIGKNVLYKSKSVKVIDYCFTCPCAIGITNHHPNDDLLMIKLENIGEVPYSIQDFHSLD